MATDPPRAAPSPALAAALGTTMVGGVLGAITDALGLPLAIGLVGLALFVAGTVTAGALAVHYSRATGQSVPRSIWLGIRTAVRWLYFFMP